MHILVVDDEPAIRDLLTDYLLEEGHAVTAARDGQEALDCADRHRPDLVLTDVAMPVMDGRHLCDHLHASAAMRAIPIVVMSAQRPRNFAAFGAFAFVAKPFNLGRLSRVLGS